MITFKCPACATSYTVSDDKSGKRTSCKKCNQPLTVPSVGDLDWELVPDSVSEEGSEGVETNPQEAGPQSGAAGPAQPTPTCTHCGSHEFAFQTIRGPVSFLEKRKASLASAIRSRNQSLQNTRDAAAQKRSDIESWASTKRASLEAQGLPVDLVATRLKEEYEAIQAWAEQEERNARLIYSRQSNDIKAQFAIEPKNEIIIVFCSLCGCCISATNMAINLEQNLQSICKAVNFLHDTVNRFIQAMAESAEAQRKAELFKAGMNGVAVALDQL